MRILLKNRHGEFEIGGGSHPVCGLLQSDGLGVVSKKATEITFAGQPGTTYTDVYDGVRTITLGLDFRGTPQDVENLYQIISDEVEIQIYTPFMSRKIYGRVLAGANIEGIIYNNLQKIVLQFSCASPYFNDIEPVKTPILYKVNHLPNLQEDGDWYVSLPTIATTGNMTGTVTNSGGTTLYPIISIINTGETQNAASGMTITNHTNGAVIVLNYTIEADDVIRFDLPNRKIVSSINGDITNSISDDTILSKFVLELGDNSISAVPADASTKMYAECEYYNNYLSAVI